VLLALLAVASLVIWRISRRNQINADNVTDGHEVLVLSTTPPPTYVEENQLDDRKHGRSRAKGAA
jgi:hypothetical protein